MATTPGIIGKWHLVSDPTGFDVWSIVPGQGLYYDPIFYDATTRGRVKGYATDITTDKAISFLETRPKDEPFFLMVHHKAPHRPFGPNEKYRAEFASKMFPEPATLFDDHAGRSDGLLHNRMNISDLTRNDLKLEPSAELSAEDKADWLAVTPTELDVEINGTKKKLRGDDLTRYKYQQYMRDYLACVQSVDDNVGRLVDYVDSHGLHDNTLVIYTSDQGFFMGEHGLFDKRMMYEPSIKMPFLARWPGQDQSGNGRERDGDERRLRGNVFGCGRRTDSCRDARQESRASARRKDAGEMADRELLPLLHRRRRTQHGRLLRHRDADTQADLLLHARSVGAVRRCA